MTEDSVEKDIETNKKKSDDTGKSFGKDIQEFHKELGHLSPKITKATAEAWNVKLAGRDFEKLEGMSTTGQEGDKGLGPRDW